MRHFDCAAASAGRVLSNMVTHWWEAYPREAAYRDARWGSGKRALCSLEQMNLLETFWLLKMR